MLNADDMLKFLCSLAGKDFTYASNLISNGFLDQFKAIDYRDSSNRSGPLLAEADVLEFFIDPIAFPLMRKDFPANLPECYVMASQFDVLRCDSELLHSKLIQSGCKSHLEEYETIHCAHLGCGTILSTNEGNRMLDNIIVSLQK